ncbi:DUF6714 family protein [Leptolyngbya sp. KIOST-1]|uniref:DUF6714 family protein n=1 Tax=Leptolyngbya sp. KIOST-1 TaxID=1229172 RepID=UPI00090798C5|nr:DUF6714 family protein [Leptolyngbya sp. KIOST-1]
MTTDSLYPCPCCGYQTLTLEPPGTYLICPICFWEDDGDTGTANGHSWTGSNRVSLRQAQRNFAALGACEPQWLNDVCAPTPSDRREPHWQTVDALAEQTRRALMESVAAAFQGVTLDGGVSLHEARARDDYEDPVQARQLDGTMRWQDIPDDWIETFHDVFAFMDAKGFRHAIPAYLLWCLKYGKQETNAYHATVSCLKSPHYRSTLCSALNPTQARVIADFLQFIDTFVWPV